MKIPVYLWKLDLKEQKQLRLHISSDLVKQNVKARNQWKTKGSSRLIKTMLTKDIIHIEFIKEQAVNKHCYLDALIRLRDAVHKKRLEQLALSSWPLVSFWRKKSKMQSWFFRLICQICDFPFFQKWKLQ